MLQGPYSPLRTACLFCFCKQKYIYIFLSVEYYNIHTILYYNVIQCNITNNVNTKILCLNLFCQTIYLHFRAFIRPFSPKRLTVIHTYIDTLMAAAAMQGADQHIRCLEPQLFWRGSCLWYDLRRRIRAEAKCHPLPHLKPLHRGGCGELAQDSHKGSVWCCHAVMLATSPYHFIFFILFLHL